MYKVTKYPHGTFSWADCNSTDVEKSKAFYTELMGWETESFPMGDGLFYTMLKVDGENATALSPMPQGMEGMPSHWSNYITVDDVDSLLDKVKELGGTVLAGPFDVFDNGRMISIQDPTGAFVSLWQAKSHIGASIVNVPGAMTWNELTTRDIEKAKEFYSKLLGWEITLDENNYNTITNKGRSNGGMMQMGEEWGDMPSMWTSYFAVSDIDAVVDKATKLGGRINTPIIDAPGVGRFASVSDPTGATCTFIQLGDGGKGQPWEE